MRVGSTLARITPSWIWKREISWTGLVLFIGATTYLNTVSLAAALSAAVVTAITLGLFLALIRAEKSAALIYATLLAGGGAAGLITAGVRPAAIPIGFLYVFTFTYSLVAALLGRTSVAGTAAIIGAGVITLFSAIIEYLTGGEVEAFGLLDMSYFIFFFALPFLNSVLDAASWAVSRQLGREMLDRNFHRWGMIGFVLLDFVLALIFLGVLAILFGAGGEMLDQFAIATTGSSLLDLDAMIDQVISEPLGDGLWITLMLFSTLVPTTIHAFVAIGSVVQMRGRKEAREKWRDEADEALADDDGLDPHTCRKIAEHWLIYRWLPSVVLLLVLLAAGWFAWQASVLPDALLAAVEWGRSLAG